MTASWISVPGEICSGAARLRISRTVREQSSTADAAGGRFLYVAGSAGELALRRPDTYRNAAPCGAASALAIALRGEDEIRTRDTVTRMQV